MTEGAMTSDGRTGVPQRLEPLPRVQKPATVRRLGPVDASALTAQVARLSHEAWRREDGVKENRFPCFHHTRHVIFRFIAGNEDPRHFYSDPSWRVWSRWLLPPMTRAASVYGFAEPVFPKAMLARLEAGQWIDTHIDTNRDEPGSHPLVHKVHIPLQTEPGAVVTVRGASTHLAPGYAWEVNNLAPHGAFNGGTRDRIHFIFEVFEGAGRELVEGSGPPGQEIRTWT